MMRRFHTLLPVLFCLLMLPLGAAAENLDEVIPPPWPSADVSVTVPSEEGDENDIYARLFAGDFLARTDRPLSFKYVPGQSGATAWARMMDDAPDGSVLTLVAFPNILLRTYQPDSGVFPSSMAFVHVGGYVPCVLWTADPAAVPTAAGSVAALAEKAAGGLGKLLVAGPGRYSATQLANRMLDRQAGVKTTYIPYTDSRAAAKAVIKGEAAAFWAYTAPVPVYGVDVKPLAVAAEERLAAMPDVPTLIELGYDVVAGSYFGFAVPGDTSKFILGDMREYFAEIAGTAEFQTKARQAGFTPMNVSGEDAMKAFLSDRTVETGLDVDDYGLRDQ